MNIQPQSCGMITTTKKNTIEEGRKRPRTIVEIDSKGKIADKLIDL